MLFCTQSLVNIQTKSNGDLNQIYTKVSQYWVKLLENPSNNRKKWSETSKTVYQVILLQEQYHCSRLLRDYGTMSPCSHNSFWASKFGILQLEDSKKIWKYAIIHKLSQWILHSILRVKHVLILIRQIYSIRKYYYDVTVVHSNHNILKLRKMRRRVKIRIKIKPFEMFK